MAERSIACVVERETRSGILDGTSCAAYDSIVKGLTPLSPAALGLQLEALPRRVQPSYRIILA